ncbi:mitochondrial thiamine pyrophosphate carrier [Geopyxis carbonaria]|nr:mitochondrial thiamine pyrophosphate carrier [Geopyxis carbonaria]
MSSTENSSKRQVFTAGLIAGLFSRFVIAPLDVVKIRLQLQPHSPQMFKHGAVYPTYRGIVPTMRTILYQEGVRGLWKGNVPAELLYMTYGGTQFLAYREAAAFIQSLPFDVPDSGKSFFSGAIAGGAATVITYPLDLLRTRFAAQGNQRVYQSLLHSVQQIHANEGIRGFFRGVGAAIIQIVPYMGIFFCTYEATKIRLQAIEYAPKHWTDSVSGGFAAAVGKTCVFPLDLIRKRLQVQGPTRKKYVHTNIPVYHNVRNAAKEILKAEGIKGLYKGLTVSLVKAAPLSAVTMWTYEQSLQILDNLCTDY